MITWAGLEMPAFRWIFANAADVINGNFVGFAILIGYLGLWTWYYKHMSKREEVAAQDMGIGA